MGSMETKWRKIQKLDSTVKMSEYDGEPILHVDLFALEELAKEAFHDISHFLRAEHLAQLNSILEDTEAS